ncbi:MAG: hypothetical protein ACTSSE_08535 [Candidatus Thorarchaeota archaeon]
MSDTDPDLPIDDQAQAFIILAAIKKSDGKPYPLEKGAAGGIIINAALPSDIDASLAVTVPDLLQHQLPDIPVLNGVSIICDSGNIGQIWFGGSSIAVGLGGAPIASGESLPFPFSNTNAIYYIAEVATDTFYVIGG